MWDCELRSPGFDGLVNGEFSSDLVDVESDVEEVDFVILPAVFLQQLHQHRAFIYFLRWFLRIVLHLRVRNHFTLINLILIIVVVVVVVIFIIFLVLLSKHQLELGILPEGLWCKLKEERKRAVVGTNRSRWRSDLSHILLYLRLPPAELPGTQESLCSLTVQVDWPVDESPSSIESGLTLQSSTTSNILLKSSAPILKQIRITIRLSAAPTGQVLVSPPYQNSPSSCSLSSSLSFSDCSMSSHSLHLKRWTDRERFSVGKYLMMIWFDDLSLAHLSLQDPQNSTKPQGFLSFSSKISSDPFLI